MGVLGQSLEGVERVFQTYSPAISDIAIKRRGNVRRAKLYYLRDRVGKAARVRERGYVGPEDVIEPGLLHAPELEPEPPAAGEDAADDVSAAGEDGVEASAEVHEPQVSADASGEEPVTESSEDDTRVEPMTDSPDSA